MDLDSPDRDVNGNKVSHSILTPSVTRLEEADYGRLYDRGHYFRPSSLIATNEDGKDRTG